MNLADALREKINEASALGIHRGYLQAVNDVQQILLDNKDILEAGQLMTLHTELMRILEIRVETNFTITK